MKGLILAAGLSVRLQDLTDRRNKVLLDVGDTTLLENILQHFQASGITETLVTVGHDAPAVKQVCGQKAKCVLNPFYERFGILSSLWCARPFLEGEPFVVTPGDHYFVLSRFKAFLADQPDAEVLADVELKTCDDEDMKVFLNRTGKLRAITKTFLDGPVLGEFTATVRFSADGSQQFFEALEKYAWQHGLEGYMADVLFALHRKWEVAFHLSQDHRRIDVDFPYDVTRARELHREARANPAA